MNYELDLFNYGLGRSKKLKYKTLEQLTRAYGVYTNNPQLIITARLITATGKKLIKVGF